MLARWLLPGMGMLLARAVLTVAFMDLVSLSIIALMVGLAWGLIVLCEKL